MLELPSLGKFMAEMRFGFSAERLVEGGHAYVHVRSLKARCRSEAYDSLTLRFGRIKELLRINTDFLPALLECLLRARSPRTLVSALGFGYATELLLGQVRVGQYLQTSRLPCGRVQLVPWTSCGGNVCDGRAWC